MKTATLTFGLDGPTLGSIEHAFSLSETDAADLLAYYAETYAGEFVHPADHDNEELRGKPFQPSPEQIVAKIASGLATGMADGVSRWKKDRAAKEAAEATAGIEISAAI